MGGGRWGSLSPPLVVPRGTCGAAHVRMRARGLREGVGRTMEDRHRHSQRCQFAAFGDAPWSGLISAQIAVKTPLQLERASATASSKALSDPGAFKLFIPSMRGQERRNDIAPLMTAESLDSRLEKKVENFEIEESRPWLIN